MEKSSAQTTRQEEGTCYDNVSGRVIPMVANMRLLWHFTDRVLHVWDSGGKRATHLEREREKGKTKFRFLLLVIRSDLVKRLVVQKFQKFIHNFALSFHSWHSSTNWCKP